MQFMESVSPVQNKMCLILQQYTIHVYNYLMFNSTNIYRILHQLTSALKPVQERGAATAWLTMGVAGARTRSVIVTAFLFQLYSW